MSRLFWRVYGFGLALLVVVTLAVGAVTFHLAQSPFGRTPERLARFVSRELGPHVDEPAALKRRLGILHEALQIPMAVYDKSGKTVVDVGKPDRSLTPIAVSLGDGARLEVTFPVVSKPLQNGVLALLGLLCALAIITYPFARAIAGPLEALTRTAQRFGAGDLAARAKVHRSDEVGALGAAFDEMAQRIEEVVKGERELLANLSHELRTPLARIRVAIEIIEQEGSLEQVRTRLKGIDEDLVELDGMIGSILETARLELTGHAGLPPLHVEKIALVGLIEDVAQRFRARHGDRPLRVVVDPGRCAIDGDRVLLRRVLDNVLDNAVRYGGEGEIEIDASVDGERVRIEIRDRGTGVAPQDLARLFQPFFRGERSRARATGGVGLGLSFSRRVVEALRGQMGAENRRGGGLIVWLIIPLARIEGADGDYAAPAL